MSPCRVGWHAPADIAARLRRVSRCEAALAAGFKRLHGIVPTRVAGTASFLSMSNRLHIGNLSSDTTAASITEAIERHGRTPVRVQVVMTRDPGRSRGFAFVDMVSSEDASAALAAVNGTDIGGRIVRVAIAHEPKSRYGGREGGPAGSWRGRP